MKIIWAQEEPVVQGRSIFLAGPTLRTPGISWRREACRLMEDRDCTVFIPEPRDFGACFSALEGFSVEMYDRQVDWEQRCLEMADRIIIWVPRDLDLLPGFTTNIEFGMWARSGKAVIGWPSGAPKMRYYDYMARKHGIPCYSSLDEVIQKTLEGC